MIIILSDLKNKIKWSNLIDIFTFLIDLIK